MYVFGCKCHLSLTVMLVQRHKTGWRSEKDDGDEESAGASKPASALLSLFTWQGGAGVAGGSGRRKLKMLAVLALVGLSLLPLFMFVFPSGSFVSPFRFFGIGAHWSIGDDRFDPTTLVFPNPVWDERDESEESDESDERVKGNEQVMVVGLHHSGTSVLAKILLDMGYWGGRDNQYLRFKREYHFCFFCSYFFYFFKNIL